MAEKLETAVTLEHSGYYAEAARLFREIRSLEGGDKRFTRHLIWLYWSAGLSEAAVKEENALTESP